MGRTIHPDTDVFMHLFRGLQSAYGIYDLTKPNKKTQAGKITGRPSTISKPVTVEVYAAHLLGRQGLGITPINEHNECLFGAIDVDDYNGPEEKLVQKVYQNNLPLIPCRTKSGGLHLYVFFTDPLPAAEVQLKLQELAAYLEISNSEIFPKQTELLIERGDKGAWINLPYFNEAKTLRYAYSPKGKALPLKEFITLAGQRRITPKDWNALDLQPKSEWFADGPPCLQLLNERGHPEGSRNKTLFNVGIYLQKKDSTQFAAQLHEYNQAYCDPPVDKQELDATIDSLKKKEYSYTCNDQPICQYCSKHVCRTRAYGIGGGGQGMPKPGTLVKMETDPPIWFVNVEPEGRLCLTTDALMEHRHYVRACIEQLNIKPILLKNNVWSGLVQGLLQQVTTQEVPREATPRGHLEAMLNEYLTNNEVSSRPDGIMRGVPYRAGDGMVYFSMTSFKKWLTKMRFSEVKGNKIVQYVREMGAETDRVIVQEKRISCYAVRDPSHNIILPTEKPDAPAY